VYLAINSDHFGAWFDWHGKQTHKGVDLSYLVLARKWRPQSFDQVVGQDAVTHTLKNAINMGRVPHALLFSGPRGVGKTTMARLLAKALNCEKGPTATPCEECSACRQIVAGTSLDVIEIDGASNTGVDDVRALRESVQYRPSSSKYRIYIIDEVHMLSKSAFNALLKTLEEPPDHVYFIFATTEPHKVPQTIQSRCQRFDFRRMPPSVAASRLKQIALEEGIKISEVGLRLLARQSEGSMRDAVSLLDQAVSFAGKEINDERLSEMLAAVDRRHLYSLCEAMIKGDARTSLEVLELIYQRGFDLEQFHTELVNYFRDLVVIKFVENADGLVEMSEPEIVELKKLADLGSEENLNLIFEFLLQAEERLQKSEHPKVVLEHCLVKCSSIKPMLKVEELLGRLDEMKKQLASGVMPVEREEFKLESAPAGEEKPGAAPAPSHSEESSPRTWEGFLKLISRTQPGLGGSLKNGRLASRQPGLINLEFAADDFCLHMLDDPDRQKQLNKAASEYFGEVLKVQCGAGAQKKNPEAGLAPGLEREGARRKLAEHPLLLQVIEIFDASLEEVKVK
jgi:DNA polymerase III subunit gamma/tau